MELFLHDCNQHIHRQRDPDLGKDCVFGGTVERFDSQMLFEPAEEEFHLPAAAIQFGYSNGRNREIVGQEDKAPARFRIDELDQAQFVRIIPVCIKVDEYDGLVAAQSGVAIHGPGVEPPIPGVALGSGDEESGLCVDVVQTGEVEIAPVEDVERTGFDGKQIQCVHVVDLSRRDVHPAGNVPPQVEQRMRFDCTDILSEPCPWKERQTETDGGGIEGVDRLRQLHSEAVGAIQISGLADQRLGEVRPDPPIAMLVGMGQCAAGDRGAHAHVIELCLMGTKAALDIPQPFPVGELREGHAQVLIHAGEGLDVPLAVVTLHTTSKLLVRDGLHHLSKNRTTSVHGSPPFYREYSPFRNSNRSRSKNCDYRERSS